MGRSIGWVTVVMLVFAPSARAALGLEAPVGEIGGELWGTWIPVTVAVIAATASVVAFMLHHNALFLTLLVIAVLIFAIGVGIPEMMGAANLQWFF